MNKRKLVVTCVLFSLISMVAAQPVNLKGSEFTPKESKSSAVPDILQFGSQQPQGHQIIQFHSPTDEEYRDTLRSKGVKFISYIPENAWIVKLNAEKDQIVSEEKVKYLGKYKNDYRVHPVLREGSGSVEVETNLFKKPELDADFLDKYGSVEKLSNKKYRIDTTYSHISDIASEEDVKWVSPTPPGLETTNDRSRQIIDVERLQNAPDNLNGSGFTAAMWDGGWAGEHADLNQTLGWTGNPKTIRNDTGHSVKEHGTHVAGTMLGNGTLENAYRGMAPQSRLITYEWPGTDYNFETEILNETGFASNDFGSVVSQNSWGYSIDDTNDEKMGNYDSISRVYDNITANYSDVNPLSIVFSAGNEGNEDYDYSPKYNRTTGPGATAKNTISVGAIDGNLDISSLSSWGPTDDNRIKPTLVAHGDSVQSTIPGNNYGYKRGTSMAAPAISGSVILLNQQYNRTHGELPPPATAKALLVHNAEDLNRTGPDYITGWGVVNATETVDYIEQSDQKNLIKRDSVSTGEYNNYTLEVSDNSNKLNFTLVWSDYPSEESSSKHLINDLDLEVRNSTGGRYYPWNLNWSTRTETAVRTKQDRVNNVVQVTIPDPQDDTYKVSVKGYNVPQAPQRYSLLTTDEKTVYPDLKVKSPENKSYKQQPDFNISSDIDLQQARFSIDGGSNRSMDNSSLRDFYNTSTAVSEGSHYVKFWGQGTEGYWGSAQEQFIYDASKPTLQPRYPSEGDNISGKSQINATWSDSASGIQSAIYKLRNDTVVIGSETLNATGDTNGLKDGEYQNIFNVTDNAGNYIVKTRNITVDNTPPSLKSAKPADKSVIKGMFDVNATWSDNEAVKNHTYRIYNKTELQINGTLNSSLDSTSLEGGKYNITFDLEDYAGNNKTVNRTVTVDNEKPSINMLKPDSDGYVPKIFDVNASINGTFSSVVEANYSLTNQTSTYRTGDLNTTINAEGLQEGDYNLTYQAEDEAGNYNSSRISLTMDFQDPSLNLLTPSDSEIINGSDYTNATYSDAGSGIEEAIYQLNQSSTKYATGNLNTSLDTTAVSDGDYQLHAIAKDKAGNQENTTVQITVDNNAPQIKSTTLSGDNFKGNIDINVTLHEVSTVEKAQFRWINDSGNVTAWTDFNQTGFDTTQLETGTYDVEYRLEDGTGNSVTSTFTGKTIDNAPPQISLKKYSQSDSYLGWYKDGRKIEASCQDEGSGFQNLKLFLNGELASSTENPHNFTVSQPGNNTYTFRCNDQVSLEDNTDEFTAIDSQSPSFNSVNPSNQSETDRSLTMTISFQDESDESWLNVSSSSLQASGADLSGIEWSNSSVTADVSGLDYSQDYSITADINDNLGHSEDVYLSYTTKSDPGSGDNEDDSNDDGGDGTDDDTGGFTPPPPEESEPEERFIPLYPGLRVEYLNLTEGVERNIDISQYSDESISTLVIDASENGRTNLTIEETEVSNQNEGLKVERSFNLSITNRSGIETTRAIFGVEKSWIESYEFAQNDIYLYRSENTLNEVSTELNNETDEKYFYTADLNQDSDYSIAADRACTSSQVSAVDPDTGVCRTYSSGCQKPDGWETVQSCSIYEIKQEAEEELERIKNEEASQEKISSIEAEIDKGNYLGAISIAESVKTDDSDNGDGLPIIPLLIGLITLLLVSGGGYISYSKYQENQEIEHLGDEIDSFGQKVMQKMDEENSKTYTESSDLIMNAKDEYDRENYDKAEELMRKSRIKFKEEDSPANRLYGDI